MTTAPDRAKTRLGSAIRTAGPKQGRFASLGSSLVAALAVAAFAGAAHAQKSLRGSGSTFVAPFLTEAFAQYALAERGPFSIGCRAVGSGAGIADFIARRVDFCATDVPMNSREVGEADGSVLQIPIALGGIALTYNLPRAIPGNLHLTRELVANIFLGKVRSWNDPSIERENARVALPDLPITIVHRSDSSGTTYIFGDFLRSVSPDWQRRVGVGKAIHWPAPRALGASGNEGVAQTVDRTSGALGYVELTYVEKSNLLAAWIQNRSGSWSFPDEQSIQAAALSIGAVTREHFSLVDAPARDAYPDGSGTTYIFTDFLSSVSAEWKSKVGTAKSVQWPGQNSVGGKGNEGVAGQVQQTPGAIGYVELAYVLENHMPQAQLINASGAALTCSPQTVGVAAATKPEISATDFSIVDRKGKRGMADLRLCMGHALRRAERQDTRKAHA